MNPDLVVVRRFFADPSSPVAVDSPLALSLHATLQRVDGDDLVMSFTAGTAFLQGAQVIQGGIVAAMLDFAMGFVVMGSLDEGLTIATSQLAVMYLRPARAGRFETVSGIERLGRSIAYTRASLLDDGGTTIATATAVSPVFARRG